MIVRLDKEQQKKARRQLLNDVVYILSHDTMKQLQSNGHTSLSPVEVFLSAQEFCKEILALPDMTEGLNDEIEDLKEEAEGKSDAALILIVASLQIHALSKRKIGANYHEVVLKILEYLDGYDQLMPLVEQMARKEESRWMEGKKSDLLNYELQCLAEDDSIDGQTVVTSIVDAASEGLSSDAILSIETVLSEINDRYSHRYQSDLDRLREVRRTKSRSQINIEKMNDIHDNDSVNVGGVENGRC